MPGGLLKGVPITTKTCRCGKVFSGQREICLKCRQDDWNAAHPRRSGPRATPEQQRESMRRWKRRSPDYHHYWHKKAKYGVDRTEMARLMLACGGACEICRTPFAELSTIAIDHDHETNRVRELLCRKCNSALGLLSDDPERIRAAAAYIEARL